MQMLKKLFNSDSKYYLELDEIEESKPVQAVIKTAEKAVDVVQEKASQVLDSQPAQEAKETAKKAADAAKEKASEVLNSQPAQEAEETAKKTADAAQDKLSLDQGKEKPQAQSKNGQKTAQKADRSDQSQPQKVSPQDAGASSFDPPFWVAAMYKNSGSTVNSDGVEAEQTFATDNLMPVITKYRRRPGPSLDKFKDMANKAKTPKR